MELKVFLQLFATAVGVFCVWAVFDFMRGKYATNDMFMELDKRLRRIAQQSLYLELDLSKVEKRVTDLEETIYGSGVKFEDVSQGGNIDRK